MSSAVLAGSLPLSSAGGAGKPKTRRINPGKRTPATDSATVPAGKPATKKKGKRKKKRRGVVAICLANCKYEVIEDCALERGWKIIDDDETTFPWNVYWTDTSVSTERVMALAPFQKINHFPGMSTLSRKAGLARNLTRMRAAFPKEFGFFPDTWTLPADYQDFKNQFSRKGTKTFIVKPDHGCQGKGIYLTRSWEAIDPAEPQVAQRYLRKPLLIDGYKFDLRIYILVLSCDPLRIYIFDDGLTRLCTEKYQEPHSRNLTNMCMHLTNYAVNKGNDNFVFNKSADEDGVGSKRSLIWFRQWMRDNGHDVDLVWRRIEHMINKTLISVQPALAHTYRSCLPSDDNTGFSCFELLGLDVMIDQKLRPWLIEVNHSPSFGCDTPLDLRIKSRLISATFSLININSSDRRKAAAQQSAEAQSRLYSGVFTPARKSVDVRQVRAAALTKLEAIEAKHSGGYSRIYPPTDEAVEAGAWPESAYRPMWNMSHDMFGDGAGRRGTTHYSRPRNPSHISARMSRLVSGVGSSTTAARAGAASNTAATAPLAATAGAGGGARAGGSSRRKLSARNLAKTTGSKGGHGSQRKSAPPDGSKHGTVPLTHAGGGGSAAAVAIINSARSPRSPRPRCAASAAARNTELHVDMPAGEARGSSMSMLQARASPITAHPPAAPPSYTRGSTEAASSMQPQPKGVKLRDTPQPHTNGDGTSDAMRAKYGSFKSWVDTKKAYGIATKRTATKAKPKKQRNTGGRRTGSGSTTGLARGSTTSHGLPMSARSMPAMPDSIGVNGVATGQRSPRPQRRDSGRSRPPKGSKSGHHGRSSAIQRYHSDSGMAMA